MRADTDIYDSALANADNWIVSPQGGAIFREGFKNVAAASVATEVNRLFQYHRGGDLADIIIEVTAGDSTVRFWIEGVLQGSTATHDFLLAELDDLYFANEGRFGIIDHAEHPPFYIELQDDGTITGVHMPFVQIPTVNYFDAKSPAVAGGDTDYLLEFVGTWTAGGQFTISYGGESPVGIHSDQYEPEPFFPWFGNNDAFNIVSITGALKAISFLASNETSVVVTVDTTLSKYLVEITGKNAGKLMTANPISGAGTDVLVTQTGDTVAGSEPAWSFPYVVLHSAVYYQCIAPHISVAANEPGVGGSWEDFWVSIGAGAPAWWAYQHASSNAWALTNEYSPWDRGFPTVCSFLQQRLAQMASKDALTSIWGSRISDFTDFARGVNDDDPFFHDINTSDTPKIKWAEAEGKAMMLGTSAGDFRVTSQVTLGPGDIQADRQNNARSDHTRSVMVNTDIFYVEQGREKIRSTSNMFRSTGYVSQLPKWASTDISIIAEHLLYASVKRLVVLHTPEVLIVALRDDGSLCCISYAPEQGVGAFYEINTQGTIVDIAAGYSVANKADELWATVTYDDVNYWIEKMPYPARVLLPRVSVADPTFQARNIILLDSWEKGTITSSDQIPAGNHTNQTLGVILDDEFVGEFLVDPTQGIRLPVPFTGEFAIGFIYTGTLTTFETAGGNAKGTALGTKRRWNELYVRLLDSALPKIHGILPPDRQPETEMEVPEIITAGIRDVKIRDLDWDDGAITITQDRPYPTHVLGMFGQYSVENA